MFKKGTRGRVLISLVLLVISANFIKSTVDVLNSRKRLEDALEKEESLTFERDSLKKRIEYKKTGEYIEESARNELNMVKPGEKVYVMDEVVPAPGEVAGASEMRKLTPASDSEDPNWYLWYKLFF